MSKIFIAAGEASGDLHAAPLIEALKARDGGLQFFGLGGELMRIQGVELIYDLKTLAVTGFWEVARRFFSFREIFRQTVSRIGVEKPRLAILVDYPGMNLRLAKELHHRDIKVVYYIAPQVWAWKPGRIKKIAERVDLLLSILPFEKALFDPTKLKCEFVGHPLLDLVNLHSSPQTFRVGHKIGENVSIIGLLPGSRAVEIARHYHVMLEAVKQLVEEGHVLAPVTAVREEIDLSLYTMAEDDLGIHPLHLSQERYDLMKAADVSIIASGTATLEAALCGKPFCVVYKTGWISYQIAKRLIRLDMVGLVNIVAGEKIVPEFLQKGLTASNLATFCRQMLHDADARQKIIDNLLQIRGRLGQSGAARRAAELIYEEFVR